MGQLKNPIIRQDLPTQAQIAEGQASKLGDAAEKVCSLQAPKEKKDGLS